jgi:hypothetical protein
MSDSQQFLKDLDRKLWIDFVHVAELEGDALALRQFAEGQGDLRLDSAHALLPRSARQHGDPPRQ